MLAGPLMICNPWRSGTFFLITLFVISSCRDSGQQNVKSVKCDRAGVQAVAELAHEVDYNAFNSTFLDPKTAKLYGIDQDEKLGVVMVSVYQTDAPGVGVEACVSGGAMNLIGQMKRLDFEEIREGEAIYHISTFLFSQEEHITFELDVEIAATGETHVLKWKQQFWRG